MVIKFINSKELLENLILVIISKKILIKRYKKKFDITWISCDSLHVWLLTRERGAAGSSLTSINV